MRKQFLKGKPLYPPHRTTRVAVKFADVDRRVVKTVRWFNSFPGVATRWACEGNDDGLARPQVVFTCDDPLELVRLLDRLYGFAEVEIEFFRPSGGLRYVARFADPARLADFQEQLANGR